MPVFLTQCPSCQTSFKVSEEQMQAANGVVRCGNCMEVFLAGQHRIVLKDGTIDEALTTHLVDTREDQDTVPADREEPIMLDDPDTDEYSPGLDDTDDLLMPEQEMDDSPGDEEVDGWDGRDGEDIEDEEQGEEETLTTHPSWEEYGEFHAQEESNEALPDEQQWLDSGEEEPEESLADGDFGEGITPEEAAEEILEESVEENEGSPEISEEESAESTEPDTDQFREPNDDDFPDGNPEPPPGPASSESPPLPPPHIPEFARRLPPLNYEWVQFFTSCEFPEEIQDSETESMLQDDTIPSRQSVETAESLAAPDNSPEITLTETEEEEVSSPWVFHEEETPAAMTPLFPENPGVVEEELPPEEDEPFPVFPVDASTEPDPLPPFSSLPSEEEAPVSDSGEQAGNETVETDLEPIDDLSPEDPPVQELTEPDAGEIIAPVQEDTEEELPDTALASDPEYDSDDGLSDNPELPEEPGGLLTDTDGDSENPDIESPAQSSVPGTIPTLKPDVVPVESIPVTTRETAVPVRPFLSDRQEQRTITAAQDADDKAELRSRLSGLQDEESLSPIEREQLEAIDEEPVELIHVDDPLKTLKTAGLVVASFILIMSLALQYVWFNLDSLVRNERLPALTSALCNFSDCPDTSRVDLSTLTMEELVVRSHPTVANALQVDFIFRNDANREQLFPLVELNFTDNNGNVIANRFFTREEYLPEEMRLFTHMPAHSSLQITLELADPGEQATGYSLTFRNP